MKKWKVVVMAAAGIIAVVIMGFFAIQSVKNKAISLEESVETAKSDIEVQEKKRADLIYNLADCVRQYDKHEAEILKNIADSRNSDGDIENVTNTIRVIAESYPELESSDQYETLMLELTTLENEIAQYRAAYNKAVERYNRYTRKTIPEMILDWTGYEKIEYNRLEYNASEEAPQNLFGESK